MKQLFFDHRQPVHAQGGIKMSRDTITATAVSRVSFGEETDGWQAHHLTQKKQDAQPVRGLVIDDNSTIIKYVTLILARLKFQEVETAQKQPEVMKKLAAGPYDLLLTDLEMPDMNGFHLGQMVKKKARDTRVIIMTGRDKDDCHEMMASGWVDGWLFKPFGLKELRSMLQWTGLIKG